MIGQLRYRYGEFLLTLEPMYRRYYCVLRWSIQTNETVGVLEFRNNRERILGYCSPQDT